MLARQRQIGNAVERVARRIRTELDRSRRSHPHVDYFRAFVFPQPAKPSQSKTISAPDIRLSSRYISVAGQLAGFGQSVSNDVAGVADPALMTA
jgi:Uri superfamily endonuclease